MERKEAVQIIRSNWPDEGYTQLREALEFLIPELKESEDEKIKEQVIYAINQLHVCECTKTKLLAWLENQCQTFTKKDVDDAYLKGVCDAKQEIEKQGEHKSVNGTFVNVDEVRENFMQEVYRVLDADPTNDRANQIIDAFDNLPTIAIQKIVDKVKPKFKVGDWISNNINTKKIIEIDLKNKDYIFENGISDILLTDSINHLWTIQDAKDGDVLVLNQITILFKKFEENSDCNFVIAYAGIDVSGKLQINDGHWLINNDAKPATKEQRDTLFAKMKESGYEWNADKKELKKIEQKPMSLESAAKIFLEELSKIPYNNKPITDAQVITKQLLNFLQNSASYNPDALIVNEHNPAWSDTDLISLGFLADFVDKNGDEFYGKNKSNVVKWIHSFPNLTTPQQDWSEEDEKLYNDLSDIYFYNDEEFPEETYRQMLKQVLGWMNKRAKSLRPQNRWISVDKEIYIKEPVLAQRKYIKEDDIFKGYVVCADHTLTPDVYQRYIPLNNIVSQNHWKPNGEQMESLQLAIESAEYNREYTNQEVLVSLMEDLKKL